MKKILFVCLGNICRSPMAEFIFRDMTERQGLSGQISCASAATSGEEAGNPVYPPARQKLAELGISAKGKRAVQLTRADYAAYDLLIAMGQRNLAAMRRICGGDPQGKMRRLLDFTAHPGDIADPWYTGDFDTACREIQAGCAQLLEWLRKQG